MAENFKLLIKSWYGKLSLIISILLILFLLGVLLMPSMFEWYTGLKNAPLTFETSKKITDEDFEQIANELTYNERFKKAEEITKDEKNDFTRKQKIQMLINTPSFQRDTKYKHIKFFRDAEIRQYDGPKTCLQCHKTMKVNHPDGSVDEVNTLDDVVNSIHFKFQSTSSAFTTFGYDGRKVNAEGRPIPVGKIDRACGIPGSFSWTGWAAIIKSYPNGKDQPPVLRSEGCGGCHIGGNYQPATELMMPGGDVPQTAKDGIDCLMCHSENYDMNYKYVIKDDVGYRWNQDRTMKTAMSVTNPTNYNCLTCHQHDMGGDVYRHNEAAQQLGYENQRILHPGTKRGTPFSPEDDVHSAAGLLCTDCHVPEGHKIPRGVKGSDLVSNDLPGKKVDCENCHTSSPHTKNELTRVILNGHSARIACETCHITQLEPENVVLRDWVNSSWNEEEGIYTPTDILHSGETNIGFTFFWYNGNGTFLANALGNNPNKTDNYNPLMNQLTTFNPKVLKIIKDSVQSVFTENGIKMNVDEYMKNIINTLAPLSLELLSKRKEMIIENIKPLQNMGKSKIYPFKLFNAYMYEDLSNLGPFGGMILPFDYNVYYETGNTLESVKKAIENPIIKRMYQAPFKAFMMDEFMKYFGVDEWSDEYPIDEKGNIRNVEPRWMRQQGTLMINHGITKDGRKCNECHSPNGIVDFQALGYSPERVKDLQNLPELKYFSGK